MAMGWASMSSAGLATRRYLSRRSRYHHHIGLNTWNGVGAPAPEENSAGLASFDIVFPDEEARKSAVQRLKAMGVTVHESQAAWITEDPSHNRIRLLI